jgi:hypothetical protein
MKEIQNVARIYESHRLYVYQSCMLVFHRLFVEPDDNMHLDGESIEDIFKHVEKIFETYNLDPLYYHLNLIFEYLKLEYYNHYGVIHQVEKSFEEVNDAASNLLINYPTYTFAGRFLITKLERHLRLKTEGDIYDESESLFEDFEQDILDVPRHTIYTIYCALGCYYVGKYEEAAKLINNLLNDVSLKRFPFVHMEVKTLLALQYCMLRDFDLFNQLSSSIQRQIRLFGKDDCENILYFLKILKIATSEAKREKPKKIMQLIPKFRAVKVNYFAPTTFIRMDKEFVENLTAIDAPGS